MTSKVIQNEYLIIAKKSIFKDISHNPERPFEDLCNIFDRTYGTGKVECPEENEIIYRIKHKQTLCDLYVEWHKGTTSTQSYLSISTKEPRKRALSFLSRIDQFIKCNHELLTRYYIISIHDEVSHAYCSLLYPRIGIFERKLKELMYLVYFSYYGALYYDVSFKDDRVATKAKRALHIKADQDLIQQIIWGLDIGDIKSILFTKRWTSADENYYDLINSSLEPDKSYCADEIHDMLSNVKPRSDWDKLFQDYIPEWDAENSISAIQKVRNKIAHCRELTGEEYDECKKEVEKATEELADAIVRFKTYKLCERKEIPAPPNTSQRIVPRSFHEITFDLDKIVQAIEKAAESGITDQYYSDDLINLLGRKQKVPTSMPRIKLNTEKRKNQIIVRRINRNPNKG